MLDETLWLAMHPSVTTSARHFVTRWAARHQLSIEVADTLELLTSEIVGNAVVHGQGPICVTIGRPRPRVVDWAGALPDLPQDGVLVQVHDTSTHQPQVQPLTTDRTGGRGLAMVELLAQQWGVDPSDGPGSNHGPGSSSVVAAVRTGKTVWFLLSP